MFGLSLGMSRMSGLDVSTSEGELRVGSLVEIPNRTQTVGLMWSSRSST